MDLNVLEMVLSNLGDDSSEVALDHEGVLVLRAVDVVAGWLRAEDLFRVLAVGLEELGCDLVDLHRVGAHNDVLQQEAIGH